MLTTQSARACSAGNLLPVSWIQPDDVAGAVLHLASEKARHVTGTSLVLIGGSTAAISA